MAILMSNSSTFSSNDIRLLPLLLNGQRGFRNPTLLGKARLLLSGYPRSLHEFFKLRFEYNGPAHRHSDNWKLTFTGAPVSGCAVDTAIPAAGFLQGNEDRRSNRAFG
jgi:hypothetical protein